MSTDHELRDYGLRKCRETRRMLRAARAKRHATEARRVAAIEARNREAWALAARRFTSPVIHPTTETNHPTPAHPCPALVERVCSGAYRAALALSSAAQQGILP